MLTEQLLNNNARLVSTSLQSHLLHSHHLEIPTALQRVGINCYLNILKSSTLQSKHICLTKRLYMFSAGLRTKHFPFQTEKKNPKCFDLKTLQRNKTESSGVRFRCWNCWLGQRGLQNKACIWSTSVPCDYNQTSACVNSYQEICSVHFIENKGVCLLLYVIAPPPPSSPSCSVQLNNTAKTCMKETLHMKVRR